MKLLRGIKLNIGFLTRLPVKTQFESYTEIAEKMYLFPIVGLIISLILSVSGIIISLFLPELLVGFLILGLLLYLTGSHHTDGLLDFGDGLMVMGSNERKIEVMHDVSIGAGGFSLGFVVLALTGIAFAYSSNNFFILIGVAEIGAKFSMIAACALGKSAKTKTAEQFVLINTKKHMIIALSISISLILLIIYGITPLTNLVISSFYEAKLPDFMGVVSILLIFFLGSFISLGMMLKISNKHFNGITGDILGALNEITRLVLLISMIAFEKLIF